MSLIDKDQAIYMLRKNRPCINKKNKYVVEQFYRDLNTIEAMPSVENMGKWIWIGDRYFCSECSNDAYGNRTEIEIGKWHYCPHCGARMAK